jgi:hypothetical protein
MFQRTGKAEKLVSGNQRAPIRFISIPVIDVTTCGIVFMMVNTSSVSLMSMSLRLFLLRHCRLAKIS